VLYGYGSDNSSIEYFDPLDANPMYGEHIASKTAIYTGLTDEQNDLVW
jgi:hypothetical protein